MNRLIARLLLACMAVVTFGLLNSGAALATFTCDDSASPVKPGRTVNQWITVRNGKSCTLTHNTVGGNITIGNGASLIMNGSTVNGSISGTNIVHLDVRSDGNFPSKINGNVTVNGETDQGFLCDTTLGGAFTLTNLHSGGYFTLGLITPGDCNGTRPLGNTIGATVSVHDNDGDIYIYNDTVGGDTSVYNNGSGSSFIRIHDNTLHGSLNATGNTGGGEIIHNTIGGSVACGNVPPFEFSSNTVNGTTSGLTAGGC